MKLRCTIGLHRWGRWDWWPFGRADALGQARWCLDCKHIQTRDI